MSDAPVYLDHNGTTPVAPEVADAMWPYLTEHCGNPSSASASGRRARNAVEDARAQVASLIGAHPDEIVFTSGGTEANNLAIRGVSRALREARLTRESTGRRATHRGGGPRVAVTSCVEHPATAEPLRVLEESGWSVTRATVDGDARVTSDAIAAFPNRIALGSLILAQNEVGTIQPVRAFADAVHAAGGVVHTDAAQAVAKIDVDVEALGVDLLSIAGHKLYAPKGIGALYVRRGTPLAPLLVGAGQERGMRPGTENVAGIVGLGRAAELARSHVADDARRLTELRERLWRGLSASHPTDTALVRLSPQSDCLPGTLMISAPGRLGRDVLADAPEIEASTGSACHAGVDSPAATLLAMGVDERTALGAIRLSLGRSTSEADVDIAAAALRRALGALRALETLPG